MLTYKCETRTKRKWSTVQGNDKTKKKWKKCVVCCQELIKLLKNVLCVEMTHTRIHLIYMHSTNKDLYERNETERWERQEKACTH